MSPREMMNNKERQTRLIGTLVLLGILFVASKFYFRKVDDNSFTIASPANGTPVQAQEEELPPASTEPVVVTEALLQGTWKAKSLIINGKSPPTSMVNASSLKIAGATYDADFAGNSDHGSFAVDLSVVPHQMKIDISEGTNAGQTLFAILEMPNASALRISYITSATTYPTTFEPEDPTGYFTALYIRQP